MNLSDDVRNARLAAIPATIGTGAVLKIRSGNLPANCAAANAGTVLATINLPDPYFGTPASGVMSLAGSWVDTAADAAGYGQHWRLETSGGTCKAQGICSEAWTALKTYVAGMQVHVGSIPGANAYRCTTGGVAAGSGGPSGTGSGITDGTAVWTYIGAAEVGIDNTNIGVGQNVTVQTMTITEGNS